MPSKYMLSEPAKTLGVSVTVTVSFGGTHPSKITKSQRLSWQDFAALLTAAPPETEDKASRGWFACAEFDPAYRDSDNLQMRSCLTFDYDHITKADAGKIQTAYRAFDYALFTTASHTAEKPRLRMVLPLSRPAGYDEFQAVSRKVAALAGIELASRESHVPAQMMYLPTVKSGATFKATINKGVPVDTDVVLQSYGDWTDRAQWPKRKDGDGVHAKADNQIPPDEKPGIVGDFCRAFDIYQAIERFDLPYAATATPGRLNYTLGSRPEGAIVYDDGLKLHSHHDTDPARGQSNSFDLVRLHRFAKLDAGHESEPITQRPSYRAMRNLALEQPEVQATWLESDFDDLGELMPEETIPAEKPVEGAKAFARRIDDVLKARTSPRWLIRDRIEQGVIAVMAGPRGSYKSFLALDWSMRCAQHGDPVYVISAEGGDYDRRARAWLNIFAPDLDRETLPLYVAERRINLNDKGNIELIRQECHAHWKIKPKLFVLDTFSKLSGGLDENDNSQVKQFIGLLDNGLKRTFDATVLLVAHTGHGDKTRVRGASALGADTDAEYIVSRDGFNGLVRLTRERFKSSPELPPIFYQAEAVTLGYDDDQGESVTSLIMRPTDPPNRLHRREPSGINNKIMWDAVRELERESSTVSVGRALELATERKPRDPEKRDQRRYHLERSLNELVSKEYLFINGDYVSSTPGTARELDEESFE